MQQAAARLITPTPDVVLSGMSWRAVVMFHSVIEHSRSDESEGWRMVLTPRGSGSLRVVLFAQTGHLVRQQRHGCGGAGGHARAPRQARARARSCIPRGSRRPPRARAAAERLDRRDARAASHSRGNRVPDGTEETDRAARILKLVERRVLVGLGASAPPSSLPPPPLVGVGAVEAAAHDRVRRVVLLAARGFCALDLSWRHTRDLLAARPPPSASSVGGENVGAQVELLGDDPEPPLPPPPRVPLPAPRRARRRARTRVRDAAAHEPSVAAARAAAAAARWPRPRPRRAPRPRRLRRRRPPSSPIGLAESARRAGTRRDRARERLRPRS